MRYLLPSAAACVAALSLLATAGAGERYYRGQPPPVPVYSSQPAPTRYWVQFRQPFWREHEFGSRAELDNYVYDRQRNGWEVQVFDRRRARDRLMHWGGSRKFDYLPEAQSWARYLEDREGYETRVVFTR